MKIKVEKYVVSRKSKGMMRKVVDSGSQSKNEENKDMCGQEDVHSSLSTRKEQDR